MLIQPPRFLIELLSRGKLPWATRVKPEENLCISISDMLRQASLTGRLTAVWSHVPNEGKRHMKVACIMKAMGLLPGTPDYFFAWAGGSGLIEVKTDKGRMSENQIYYQSWCASLGVRHNVCRSLEAVHDTLAGWGILKGDFQ